MSDAEYIAKLQQLVADLWQARSYGINELSLLSRVNELAPSKKTGVLYLPREVNNCGVSVLPDEN